MRGAARGAADSDFYVMLLAQACAELRDLKRICSAVAANASLSVTLIANAGCRHADLVRAALHVCVQTHGKYPHALGLT